MEDFLDNFLYIIILIASIVISALGKKKKKQVQQGNTVKSQNNTLTSNFNLEKLIKEQMGIVDEYENDFIDSEPEIELEPVIQQEKEKPLDYVPEYMLNDKKDYPYSIEYQDTKIEAKQETEEILFEKSEEKSIFQDFDLEEAVIYSEILNRKEY